MKVESLESFKKAISKNFEGAKMKLKKRVFEVKQIHTRTEETVENTIILQLNEAGEWVYLAPNAQTHTIEQLEVIIDKLKFLNEGVSEK